MNAIMHSPRKAFTMENRPGTCGYQAQRAFHLPLRGSRFGDQVLRTFVPNGEVSRREIVEPSSSAGHSFCERRLPGLGVHSE